MSKCYIFHQWSDWERVSPWISSMDMTFTDKRICSRCGKTQIMHIRDAVSGHYQGDYEPPRDTKGNV